jgi:hypothetical protein
MPEDSNTSRFNVSGSVYGAVNSGSIAGNFVTGDNNVIISGEKRTLAETAAEIQALLRQLEKTNPVATDAEKVAYIDDETTPSFKRRVVGALQASGEAGIEEFFDNPYVNLGKAVIKGWIKPE